jgi:hypothetical protein
MSWVKTFRITEKGGVPDKEIREFINAAEREAIVNVATSLIPPLGTFDARLTVIITKLDEIQAI